MNIYCGLEALFLCGNIPGETVWVQYFCCEGCFGMDACHVFPQSVLAIIPLMGLWLVVWPEPTLDVGWGLLFALCCHSSVRGRVCSPVVGVEALRVGFDKALSPFSVCSGVHQGDEHWSEWGLCGHSKPMRHPCRRPRFCQEAAQGCDPFSVVFVPDLVLGWHWGPGRCGFENRSGCAATWDLGCLHGRALPGPVCPKSGSKLRCEVGGMEHSCQERNHWVLLPRGCLPRPCDSVMPPRVHANKVCSCWNCPPACACCGSADNGL